MKNFILLIELISVRSFNCLKGLRSKNLFLLLLLLYILLFAILLINESENEEEKK